MDDLLQKKIHSLLLTVTGLNENNLFYHKASGKIDSKSFPRTIYSLVSDIPSFDTEQEHHEVLIQISSFDHFKALNVENLKLRAAEIKYKMTITNLSGVSGLKISRCKLNNYRESELDDIFQIDQDFRINFSRI